MLNPTDLTSFIPHLPPDPQRDAGPSSSVREQIAAYLLGYAARLHFPSSVHPTDESMRHERQQALGPREWQLHSRLVDLCRRSFAEGWTDAGEALARIPLEARTGDVWEGP